jgi:hypothetical protein
LRLAITHERYSITFMPPFAIETLPADTAGPSALSAADPGILASIGRRDVHLAVWARRLPPPLLAAAKRIALAGPVSVAVEEPPDQVADAIADRWPGALPAVLLHDIRALAVLFAMLRATPRAVRARLEAVHGRGCWRWHADAVPVRLLCTYHGPGTEVLDSIAGAEAARALPPDTSGLTLPTGAVALLKGEGHPGGQGRGCIHRSPQEAGPRLLLCLDEPGRIPVE